MNSSQKPQAAHKEKLLVLLGPTASGKTALSIQLAHALQTEIISGDSMLVYKKFDIGTAKPTFQEMEGVPHHMVDILPSDASFNLMDFLTQVKEIITQLNHEGKIPLLVGGTGLYIQSLLEGYELNQQQEDSVYRRQLEELAQSKGRDYVHGMLAQANPEAAARLHPNDLRRVIRALEVHHLGGSEVSRSKAGSRYDAYVAGLSWDRNQLYDRINRRVDIMLQQGLLQEVQGLLSSGVPPECQAMKGIGYKEILPVLSSGEGSSDLAAAVEKIKQNSRHFAKRQLTWYRRMSYIHWYQPALYEDTEGLASSMLWDIGRWLNK